MIPLQEQLPFGDAQEKLTTSPWSQRWRDGKHSWQHLRDGGFDARRYRVDVISEEAPAKRFVLAHHYSRSWPLICICQVLTLVKT